MVSLLLLVLTMSLSAIVVRIGTIALEITGLPEEKARFQATSAYAGVGFTTKESELVLTHPQRRKVIGILISVGSAGVIATIGTFAGTLVSGESIFDSVMAPGTIPWLPLNLAQILLLLASSFALTVYVLLSRPRFRRLVDEIIATWLIRQKYVLPDSFEEVSVNSDGFGVVRVDVSETNQLCGKAINQCRLREKQVVVLSIERGSEALTYPPESVAIQKGDRLTLFGPVGVIRSNCTPLHVGDTGTSSSSDGTGSDAPLPLGSTAPQFTLPDQNGEQFDLESVRGQSPVIIVFYPKDRSFHCSGVLQSFNEYLPELERHNIRIVAINPASQESHRKFCEVLKTGLPILSDRRSKVCKAYRALMFLGFIVNRSVYVVDKQGRIAYAKRGRPPVVEVIAAAKSAAEG